MGGLCVRTDVNNSNITYIINFIMKQNYEEPQVLIEQVLIEKGFATSFGNGNGIDDAPENDFGEF